MCSSVLGPAMPPPLVTCPTSSTAGLASHQHDRPRHDATAQDEVELAQARLPPPHAGPFPEGGQADGGTAGRNNVLPVRPSASPPDRLLHQRIPRPTRLAASAPLGLLRAAVRAAEHRASLSHARPQGVTRASCSCRSACIPS